jgi:hypothetical protein
MSATDDYCELCDLPKSQCIHGQPPPAATPPTKAPATAATRRTSPTRTPGAPARSVNRRWTPPADLKPSILVVLEDAGGELDVEDVLERLETRLADSFRAGDHETTPNGELRWHYAARRARQELIDEGLISRGRPGTWTLASDEAARRTR